MVWLMDKVTNDMITAAESNGLRVSDVWWRDESVLETWWLRAGYPLERKAICVPIPCGEGTVAWVELAAVDELAGMIWGVLAIAPDEGLLPCSARSLAPDPANPKKWPSHYITQTTARDMLKIPAKGPATPGSWVGGCGPAREGFLAKCGSILGSGWVRTVIRPDGVEISADSLAKRWFVFENRDEACEFYWNSGEVDFSSYQGMINKLRFKQEYFCNKLKIPYVTGEEMRNRAAAAKPKPEDYKEGFEAGKAAFAASGSAAASAGSLGYRDGYMTGYEHARVMSSAKKEGVAPVRKRITDEEIMEKATQDMLARCRQDGAKDYSDGKPADYHLTNLPYLILEARAAWCEGWKAAELEDII